jgi:tetratricopeptide (TPR) repeat protein
MNCQKNKSMNLMPKLTSMALTTALLCTNSISNAQVSKSQTLSPTKVQTKSSSKKESANKKSSSKKSANKKIDSKTSLVSKKPKNPLTPEEQLQNLRLSYRDGSTTNQGMWIELNRISNLANLEKEAKANLLLAQANILARDEYPILASIFASQAITLSSSPQDKELERAWKILWDTSAKAPILNILEIVADSTLGKLGSGEPQYFGSNWHYVNGRVSAKSGDMKGAIDSFQKVDIKDRYLANAQFQTGLLALDNKDSSLAMASFRKILNPSVLSAQTFAGRTKMEVANNARLALARIHYEQREFDKSIQYYRSVDKNSDSYYDALFEQSWALFMAGYPNHALGAIHGAQSPFFKDVFNPELDILKSIIFYWICDYDAASDSLAKFVENHRDAVASLGDFLNKKRLVPETAYTLFEDLISNVSESSLGIPKHLIETATNRSSMLLIREQFAAFLTEKQRLEKRGVFGSQVGTETAATYMERLITSIKKDLGSQLITEFRAMKESYDELFTQSEFLYLELLMSQKDKILGKQLHASSKMTSAETDVSRVKGWAKDNRSWDQSEHNEYWWDEVGYYVYQAKPECNQLSTSSN